MLAPDLFGALDPPALNVTLHRLEPQEEDRRLLSLSILPRGRKGLHVSAYFGRYSPEETVLRAIEETVKSLHLAQGGVNAQIVNEILHTQMTTWVEPF
jgi:hypothetical protein